jgi:hypothetical protein
LTLLTVETEVIGKSKNTNERGPSLVGSLGLSGWCKRILSCLGCSSRPSTKYFCPHRTLFQLICPYHQQVGQAVVLGGLSLNMCLCTELYEILYFILRLLWRTCTIRLLFLKHNLVTLSFTETAVLQSFQLWQFHLFLTQCHFKLYLLLLEPWSHDSSWQRELRGIQDRSYLYFF